MGKALRLSESVLFRTCLSNTRLYNPNHSLQAGIRAHDLSHLRAQENRSAHVCDETAPHVDTRIRRSRQACGARVPNQARSRSSNTSLGLSLSPPRFGNTPEMFCCTIAVQEPLRYISSLPSLPRVRSGAAQVQSSSPRFSHGRGGRGRMFERGARARPCSTRIAAGRCFRFREGLSGRARSLPWSVQCMPGRRPGGAHVYLPSGSADIPGDGRPTCG